MYCPRRYLKCNAHRWAGCRRGAYWKGHACHSSTDTGMPQWSGESGSWLPGWQPSGAWDLCPCNRWRIRFNRKLTEKQKAVIDNSKQTIKTSKKQKQGRKTSMLPRLKLILRRHYGKSCRNCVDENGKMGPVMRARAQYITGELAEALVLKYPW